MKKIIAVGFDMIPIERKNKRLNASTAWYSTNLEVKGNIFDG